MRFDVSNAIKRGDYPAPDWAVGETIHHAYCNITVTIEAGDEVYFWDRDEDRLCLFTYTCPICKRQHEEHVYKPIKPNTRDKPKPAGFFRRR
jgi:hypothetical protein